MLASEHGEARRSRRCARSSWCCCARSACCPPGHPDRDAGAAGAAGALQPGARGRPGRGAPTSDDRASLQRRAMAGAAARRSTSGRLRRDAAAGRAGALAELKPQLRALLHYHCGVCARCARRQLMHGPARVPYDHLDAPRRTALSVNLNKVALVRNTRHAAASPASSRAATLVPGGRRARHHRPSAARRAPHPRRRRARAARAAAGTGRGAEFNIEGNPFHNLMDFVRELRPAPVHLRARQRRPGHQRPRLGPAGRRRAAARR